MNIIKIEANATITDVEDAVSSVVDKLILDDFMQKDFNIKLESDANFSEEILTIIVKDKLEKRIEKLFQDKIDKDFNITITI
jgi:hypothetical protein